VIATYDTAPLARRLVERRERAILTAAHVAAQTDGRNLNPVEDLELDDALRVAADCSHVLDLLGRGR
jgi:hypothetical protein